MSFNFRYWRINTFSVHLIGPSAYVFHHCIYLLPIKIPFYVVKVIVFNNTNISVNLIFTDTDIEQRLLTITGLLDISDRSLQFGGFGW